LGVDAAYHPHQWKKCWDEEHPYQVCRWHQREEGVWWHSSLWLGETSANWRNGATEPHEVQWDTCWAGNWLSREQLCVGGFCLCFVFLKVTNPGGHQVESAVCPCSNEGQWLGCISKSVARKLMETIILPYHLGERSWKTVLGFGLMKMKYISTSWRESVKWLLKWLEGWRWDLVAVFNCLFCSYRENGTQIFSEEPRDRTGGSGLAARPWCSNGNSGSNGFIEILTGYKENKCLWWEGLSSGNRLPGEAGIRLWVVSIPGYAQNSTEQLWVSLLNLGVSPALSKCWN